MNRKKRELVGISVYVSCLFDSGPSGEASGAVDWMRYRPEKKRLKLREYSKTGPEMKHKSRAADKMRRPEGRRNRSFNSGRAARLLYTVGG
jgi:hypothetical protein